MAQRETFQNLANPKRRDALKKIGQNTGFALFGALLWGGYVNLAKAGNGNILRPPGASMNDSEFVSSCIKCGLCVEACPYYTLRLATPGDEVALGTPFFEARKIPCYMCKDIPCARACPTDALDLTRLAKPKGVAQNLAKLESAKNSSESADIHNADTHSADINNADINNATMGVAIVDSKHCVAYAGIQCDACYRACPLMDKAIALEYRRNDRTGKHGFLLPIVDSDHCTGCGMCEKACVTELPTIIVLPRPVALGKMGTNYIKGWDKADEARLFELKDKPKPAQQDRSSKSLDYLNEGGF